MGWKETWAMARESGDPGLLLATITHPAYATERFVRNNVAVTSRGETFRPAYFEIGWVNDDGQVPRVDFSFPNVSPEIGRRFERVTEPHEVTLEVINLAYPDEPVARVARLQLRDVRIDALTITGELRGRDLTAEPLGSIVVLPSNFPALYRAQK